MSVDEIEKAIPKLSPEERAKIRALLEEIEADEWDRQIERDVKAGKFDKLADQVLADHAEGKTKPL